MKKAFVVMAVVLASRAAHAVPYETFIDVDDEEDLNDLLAANDISQDTYDEILDLLEQGVDLNIASRAELYALPNLTYDEVDKIIAYRSLNKGRINDPSDLVAAGALTQEQLEAISAFITVRKQGENPLAVHGWIKGETRYTIHDSKAPPIALRARFTFLKHFTAGIALTSTRLEIGDPQYDPNRDALIADPASYSAKIAKAYVKYEDNDYSAIVGSYRAGFAQRLVFDNSRHYTPNGLYLDDQVYYSSDLTTDCKESAGELLESPCAGAASDKYITPDWVWRDSLFGVGLGAKKIELETGWIQAYAFASESRRSIYQYELVEKNNPDGSVHCADPHDDANPDCGAPVVYVRPGGNVLNPAARYSFTTLPNVFLEKLVGGNVTYYRDRRNSVGITAYGAEEDNLVSGIDLSFQEWSTHPFGGKFGAIGGNFAFGKDWFDIFGEAAISFDNQPKYDPAFSDAPNGGGGAAILRMTATRKHEELEVVGRYYSTGYANPYARPISEADEFDGQRARDEAGVRVRYVRSSKDFQLRALVDLWENPSAGNSSTATSMTTTDDSTPGPKLDTYVRANVRTTDGLWLGLWERYQDKDLERGGHNECFEVSTDMDENGEPIPCGGRQLTSILRAQYRPDARLTATLMLEHQLLDDNTKDEYLNSFRQDLAAWAIVLWKPNDDYRVRARVRYLNESINDAAYLETSFSTIVDAMMKVRSADKVGIRFDTKFWLDDRQATMDRVPNPELTFWLRYEAHI
ncbi:MAG TPA: helix-hairpin-helix domain-containing protein [Kofleriaceae bacterium]